MKNLFFIYCISLLVATVLVFTSLEKRQEAKRTGTDAYIPIRTITPLEAAALFTANSNRKPDTDKSVIVTNITDRKITLLTRNYPVEVSPAVQKAEDDNIVIVHNKAFRIFRNSWESYLCQYTVDKIPLEKILNYNLSITPLSDLDKDRYNTDKISFSSENISFYIIGEIIALS